MYSQMFKCFTVIITIWHQMWIDTCSAQTGLWRREDSCGENCSDVGALWGGAALFLNFPFCLRTNAEQQREPWSGHRTPALFGTPRSASQECPCDPEYPQVERGEIEKKKKKRKPRSSPSSPESIGAEAWARPCSLVSHCIVNPLWRKPLLEACFKDWHGHASHL